MALSWNQIRTNATQFSHDWKDASYEKGESQSFYNDFFELFGVKRRSVARFEDHVRKLDNSSGFIDLYWPGVLLVEHKSLGGDLKKAITQAEGYFDAVPEGEKPRYLFVCDFQSFILIDLDQDEHIEFQLADLPDNVERFFFILGRQKPLYQSKEPINIDAAKRIGNLYDFLVESGYPDHDLEKLLVRLVFCLFADDTGIFQPRGIFHDQIDSRTNMDGSDLGQFLSILLQTLNTPLPNRQKNIDPDLAQFPYINGDLFAETISISSFNKTMREELIKACLFDWSSISPAIFGSLFQVVLSKELQRELGGHFTTEENILKAIKDLFLDDIWDSFHSLFVSKKPTLIELRDFQSSLRNISVFDPACGCGNFLIVAYRELRRIELAVLSEISSSFPIELKKGPISLLDVDQFFGIELREYSARIAESALWMTDHIANIELSLELGIDYSRIPLEKIPVIEIGDALSLDWNSILPPESCSYIICNPPYRGAKIQSPEQREQIRTIANLTGRGGTLDFVCGWLIKAASYALAGSKLAFVTTSSIIQGEQVGQLWTLLFGRFSLEISFAHQTFNWTTESSSRPNVDVVIIGLVSREAENADKNLYKYETPESLPTKHVTNRISPYLIDGALLNDPHIVVEEQTLPINGFPHSTIGSKPIDGGYYILSRSEMDDLLKIEPAVKTFIHPFIGAREFLKGTERYILYLGEATPKELSSLKNTKKIIDRVRQYRAGKLPAKGTTKYRTKPDDLANTPLKFHVTRVPDKTFLIIPEVTSERRIYIPIAWMNPPVIPSNLVKIVPNATLYLFALLTSAMHMSWVRIIGGRLESRYRYSIKLVYNNFPPPKNVSKPVMTKIENAAKDVLKCRQPHTTSTLEELYDPNTMPTNLIEAHQKLDAHVDKLYMGKQGASDEERVAWLLNEYKKIVTGP